jgi:hypothetical protein
MEKTRSKKYCDNVPLIWFSLEKDTSSKAVRRKRIFIGLPRVQVWKIRIDDERANMTRNQARFDSDPRGRGFAVKNKSYLKMEFVSPPYVDK